MKIYLEINLDTENCVEFCVEFARDRVFFEKIHFFFRFFSLKFGFTSILEVVTFRICIGL